MPEAVECDPAGAQGIRVCKHCQRGWCTPRGDPLCEPPPPDHTGRSGDGHDDLYWQVRVPCGSERCLRGMLINGPVFDSRRSQGAPGNTRFLANTIAGGYDFGRLYWSQSPTYLRACGRKESKWFNPGPNREQRCSQERASAQQIAKIRAHFGLDRGLGRRPPPTAIVPLDPAVQRTFKKITRLLGFADIHPPDADKGWQFDEHYMQAWQEEYERKIDIPEIARKVQLRIAMHAATVINASVRGYLSRRAKYWLNVRKRLNCNGDGTALAIATRLAKLWTGMNMAAAVIQAFVRGYLTRRAYLGGYLGAADSESGSEMSESD